METYLKIKRMAAVPFKKITAMVTVLAFSLSLVPLQSVFATQNLRQENAPPIVAEAIGRQMEVASATEKAYQDSLSVIQREAEGDERVIEYNKGILKKLFKDLGTDDLLFRDGPRNLGDLAAALYRQQKNAEVLTKDLGKAVSEGAWKLENLEQGRVKNIHIWKLLNTARRTVKPAEYSGQEVCKVKAGERPCPLDHKRKREFEKQVLYEWRDYFLYSNMFPVFEGHTMVTYKSHLPQFVKTQIIKDMLELVFKLQDYTIYYNHVSRYPDQSIYANCGSTVPEHNHCQAIPKHLSPIPGELTQGLPIESAPTELIAEIDKVSISKLRDYPARAIVVEGVDTDTVASQAAFIVKLLDEKIKEDIKGYEQKKPKGSTTGIVGYNIVWTRKADTDIGRIIIIPRATDNRPSMAVQDGEEKNLYSGNKKEGIIGIKDKLFEKYQKEKPEADMDALAILPKDKVEQLFESIKPTEEERLVFDKLDIGIASVEMSGIVVATNGRDFERLTLKEAQSILDQCSTPEGFLEPIYKMIKAIPTVNMTGSPREIGDNDMPQTTGTAGAAGVKYEKVEPAFFATETEETKRTIQAIDTLEKNMPFERRMSPGVLMEHLKDSKSIIFIARDMITNKIIGYIFGVPQGVVPKTIPSTSEHGNAYIDQTFYEMSWQVSRSHQRKGIGTGLRHIFRNAVRNAGYFYLATHQRDEFEKNQLKSELSERYGQGDELFDLVRPSAGTNIPQYVLIKLNRVDVGSMQVTPTAGAAQQIAELTAAELAELKASLIAKLAPEMEKRGYALVLHPEPAGDDAKIIRDRLMELGFDENKIKIVATIEKAQQLIDSLKDEILLVVNRLPGVNLTTLIAGLPIKDVSGNVASVIPETAKDLEIWV